MSAFFKFALVVAFIAFAHAQQIGSQKKNVHLPMTVGECTASGCTSKQQGVVLDGNWRWIHKKSTYTNCYTGVAWDPTLCPDPTTCTENCALDGVPSADWKFPYGVSGSGADLDLSFVVKDPKTGNVANVGSRSYMMDGDSKYKMFKLKNREFTFDVDVSNLPCGLNGALYFVEMQEDGGLSEYPTNKAGAAFGTGYCDAQCPKDVKFINGEANTMNWTNQEGHYGSCTSRYAHIPPHPVSLRPFLCRLQ
jgi:cellulose 1,4-beta-cellobiosidase